MHFNIEKKSPRNSFTLLARKRKTKFKDKRKEIDFQIYINEREEVLREQRFKQKD